MELTELAYQNIPGWTFDDSVYGSSGPPYDLTPHLMQVEINDIDESGIIAVNTGDTITVNGAPQKIGLIYYGDTVVIDGVTVQTVSIYVGPGNAIPIVFPILNGKVSSAFGGDITSSQGTGTFGAPIPYDQFACFSRGTMIAAEHGVVAIETIKVGDLVMTRDNGLQSIKWIGSAWIGGTREGIPENLRPIRIAAGALGPNLPSDDLLVSPQHRILIRSKIARRMFGADEILVAAKQLLQLDGVNIANDLRAVEYFHFLLDRHEIVISNGTEAESLYTGPEALRSVGPQAEEEILTLFPELEHYDRLPSPARVMAAGKRARKLVERHAANLQPLV